MEFKFGLLANLGPHVGYQVLSLTDMFWHYMGWGHYGGPRVKRLSQSPGLIGLTNADLNSWSKKMAI